MTYLENDRREIFLNLFYPERFRTLDVEKWVDAFAKNGATSFCLDIKDQAYVYYDSKYAPKWDVLGTRDLAREFSDAVRKRGLKWSAYIAPMEFEWLAGDKSYEDWQVRFEDGSTPPGNIWNRKRYCWNSPYAGLFLNVLREIAEKYHPDGFYLDGVSYLWFHERALCYCKYCRERFQREFNSEMPSASDVESEKWPLFIRARQKWNADIARRIRECIDSVDPRITLVTNCVFGFHGWTCSTQPETAKHFDFMCAEDPPGLFRSEKHPPGFSPTDTFFWKAALLRMLGGGKQGEFYSNYPLDVPLAEALFNIDLYCAAGMRTAMSVTRNDAAQLFGRLREMEPWTLNLTPAPEIVMHFSENTHIGGFRSHAAMPKMLDLDDDPFFREPMAYFKAALDTHTALELVSDDDLDSGNLHGSKALILPDSRVLSEKFRSRMQDEIERGLRVLATMEPGTRDYFGKKIGTELLFEGSGLRSAGEIRTQKPWLIRWKNGKLEFEEPVPDADAKYLSFMDGPLENWIGENIHARLAFLSRPVEERQMKCLRDDENSVHFPFEAVRIKASGEWKVLAGFKYLDAGSGKWRESPAILSRRFGNGEVIYLAFRLATCTEINPVWFRKLTEKLFRLLAAHEKTIEIKAPPCVKAVCFRQSGDRIIHLVNDLSPQPDDVFLEERIAVPVEITLKDVDATRVSVPVCGGTAVTADRSGNTTVSCAAMRDRMVLRIGEPRKKTLP